MNDQLKQQFKAIADTLQGSDLAWAAGYLEGKLSALSGASALPSVAAAVPAEPAKPVTLGIYYATETGNAKKIAIAAEKLAKSKNIKTKALAFSKIKPADFKKQDAALFLLSTHGEGEYPDAAKGGVATLEKLGANDLSDLPYAVIGLGDSAYNIFCGAAVQFEDLLKSKGAKSFSDTHLFDVDFDSHYPSALDKIIADLPNNNAPAISGTAVTAAAPAATIGTSRLNAVTGVIQDIVNLNDNCSDKETYHIEIAFEEGIQYRAGDAVGIVLPEDENGKAPPPRLYSIASSQAADEETVHITVALAKHKNEDGSIGFGICSKYLSELKNDDEVKFYIHKNDNFKLPEDPNIPIIMVGPGTGIAPFRSFIQEREAQDATGKNWLFFGDRTSHADFLYQAEWQDYVAGGLLTNIDLAFSRDNPDQKIYVQDKMKEKGSELIKWLDEGAYFYVCGTKDPMSLDVEKALIQIAVAQKGLSENDATAWLEKLTDEGRYQKDVY